MTKVVRTSETSVYFNDTTQSYNPGSCCLQYTSLLVSILVLIEIYLMCPLMRLHVPPGIHGPPVQNSCLKEKTRDWRV
jgi:hypothetical protein